MKAQEYDEDFLEAIAERTRLIQFDFTILETWAIFIGAALLTISWWMIKREDDGKDNGCLSPLMFIVGLFLMLPLILAIIYVGMKIIYYGLIIGVIVLVIWGIFTSYGKNK